MDPQLEELMRFTLAAGSAAAKPIHTDHPQDLASARGFLSHEPRAGLKKKKNKSQHESCQLMRCVLDFRRKTWLLWESVRLLPALTPHPGHISCKILVCLPLSFPANWPIAASQANSYLKIRSEHNGFLLPK